MATSFQVTFDCADPGKIGAFWAEALGYKRQDPPEGFTSWPEFLAAQGVPESAWNSRNALVDPSGEGPRLFFQQVPESKTVKNRVHLDLNIGGGLGVPLEERKVRIDREAERLTAAGATKLYDMTEMGVYTVTMQDPEGNEFCVH